MKKFQSIGITGNTREKNIARTINKIIHLLNIFEKDYILDKDFDFSKHPAAPLDEICKHSDILFVIGGDGSFLKAARKSRP